MKSDPEDRAFFEQSVVQLLDRLFGAALRLTRNRADAEDLVAEAVAKDWAQFAALRDRNCFSGWLFLILTTPFGGAGRRPHPVSIEALAEAEADCEGEAAFSIFQRLHQPFLLWWDGGPGQDFLNKG